MNLEKIINDFFNQQSSLLKHDVPTFCIRFLIYSYLQEILNEKEFSFEIFTNIFRHFYLVFVCQISA